MMRFLPWGWLMLAVLANHLPDVKVHGAPVVPGDSKTGPLLGVLPDDITVQAVGTYKGSEPINVELDDSGHQVTIVNVVVNRPDKPVVLVLSAYDPVIWKVGRTPETRIVGVIIGGYHGQTLTGLTKDTPIAISTLQDKGTPRFKPFYAHSASKQLLEMNETVSTLVGHEIDFFQYKPVDGVFYIGERPGRSTDVVYSEDLQIKPSAIKSRPEVGVDALDVLVEERKIRPATQADVDAWTDKASEKYKKFNPDLRINTPMRPERTFVVLQSFTLPKGLFGGHLRFFIIPEGVPEPDGDRAHCTFFYADGRAEGPLAPRD